MAQKTWSACAHGEWNPPCAFWPHRRPAYNAVGIQFNARRSRNRGVSMPKSKRRRAVKSLPHAYEVKAEISNATLAKAKSALTLQIYRKELKLGELQIGRGSLFWAGARRQSAKRIHWGRRHISVCCHHHRWVHYHANGRQHHKVFLQSRYRRPSWPGPSGFTRQRDQRLHLSHGRRDST